MFVVDSLVTNFSLVLMGVKICDWKLHELQENILDASFPFEMML